jgi:hypothetical protein
MPEVRRSEFRFAVHRDRELFVIQMNGELDVGVHMPSFVSTGTDR